MDAWADNGRGYVDNVGIFDGTKRHEWMAWYNQFYHQFHNKAHLNENDKLEALKKHTAGAARRIVNHYLLGASQYKDALRELRDEYGDKHYYVSRGIQEILTVPEAVNASEARELLQRVNEILHRLIDLGLNVRELGLGLVLITSLCAKLPVSVCAAWYGHLQKRQFRGDPEIARLYYEDLSQPFKPLDPTLSVFQFTAFLKSHLQPKDDSKYIHEKFVPKPYECSKNKRGNKKATDDDDEEKGKTDKGKKQRGNRWNRKKGDQKDNKQDAPKTTRRGGGGRNRQRNNANQPDNRNSQGQGNRNNNKPNQPFSSKNRNQPSQPQQKRQNNAPQQSVRSKERQRKEGGKQTYVVIGDVVPSHESGPSNDDSSPTTLVSINRKLDPNVVKARSLAASQGVKARQPEQVDDFSHVKIFHKGCFLCGQEHHSATCKNAKDMNWRERWYRLRIRKCALARGNEICFNCHDNHLTPQCKKPPCAIITKAGKGPICRLPHPPSMHHEWPDKHDRA